MREIYVDLDAVMAAFEYTDIPIQHYLDLETGSVVMVTDETRYLLEAIYEEYWDPDSDSEFDLEAALDNRGIFDWQREALLEADAVEEHFRHRYIEIP
ncbi:MAG: hypothetical protein P1S60_14070, partial [Anaerolineae bacterium]|nr:hypothetical protein [Anaerolineae bacterium]